jgi:[ribosomal protein S18]-alanine N-acetyltransferase
MVFDIRLGGTDRALGDTSNFPLMEHRLGRPAESKWKIDGCGAVSGTLQKISEGWGWVSRACARSSHEPCDPPRSGYNNPVEFCLRDFRKDDLETLWSIDQQCFPADIAYSRAELAAYVRQAGAITVVAQLNQPPPEVPAGIAGFIVAHARRGGVGHVITIDVLPEARRSRVGSRLLEAAEERLQAAGCRGVYLETAVDNTSALAFYKRHQYFLVKTVPRYYSNGVDAFVLQKDLPCSVRAS